jgi:hypothetical protein
MSDEMSAYFPAHEHELTPFRDATKSMSETSVAASMRTTVLECILDLGQPNCTNVEYLKYMLNISFRHCNLGSFLTEYETAVVSQFCVAFGICIDFLQTDEPSDTTNSTIEERMANRQEYLDSVKGIIQSFLAVVHKHAIKNPHRLARENIIRIMNDLANESDECQEQLLLFLYDKADREIRSCKFVFDKVALTHEEQDLISGFRLRL